jgi:hypothetical protein
MWDAWDVMRSVEAQAPAVRSPISSLFKVNHYEFYQFAEFAFDQSLHALDKLYQEIVQFHKNLLTMSFKLLPFMLKFPQVFCEKWQNSTTRNKCPDL